MPQMQWIKAEQQDSRLHLHVWLDTAKTLPDSTEPDPQYVREYRFAATPPEGITGPWTLNGTSYTEWQSYVLAEAQLLAAAEYAALTAPLTTLSVAGEVFSPS
ncbi:MAG: hypothetical protein ACYCPS_05335 [Candidatus Saccharimonadales bacterium]